MKGYNINHMKQKAYVPPMLFATSALQPMPQRDGPPQSCNAQYDNQVNKIFHRNLCWTVSFTIFSFLYVKTGQKASQPLNAVKIIFPIP